MPGGVTSLQLETAMDEKYYERQLVDEIRALRADLRRWVVIAIGVFVGMCVCGFVLFSNHA